MDPMTLWFNTPDTHTLCRAGGNGPEHPSQLYAIRKYIYFYALKSGPVTFLDYGCGSGTTYEALKKTILESGLIRYRGIDIIPKNIAWCKEQWPEANVGINAEIHRICEPDKSYDVVYSRHVVDHMESFEKALDEHCRVARTFVIIVLWRPFIEAEDHEIKHIVDQGKFYADEYTNDYSRRKVMAALVQKESDGWQTREVAEGIGKEVKGFDTVIVLERR